MSGEVGGFLSARRNTGGKLNLSMKTKIILFIAILSIITLGTLHFSSPPPSPLLLSLKELSEVHRRSPKTPEDDSVLVASTTIHRGETIYESLLSAGLSSEDSYAVTQALKPLFNPNRCKPGDLLKLKKSPDGRIIFEYFPNSLEYYLVEESKNASFSAYREKTPRRKVVAGIKVNLQSSVYESMRKEGLDPGLINRFTDIFAWEIDFFTDPQKGDTFELVWERYLSPEGKILMEGKILAAQYTNVGRPHTAILFKDPKGRSDYYTPEGNSLRRSFLRSPLNYTRISSRFSYRRLHPILRIYRPHLGIDYAAPSGTPVSTVADGTITFVGWRGGLGRLIKIKHRRGIVSSYGHLSRFAKGIRRGKRVRQGQTIGYVGSTGLSTGPHLDFRITKNGRYINFLKEKFPAASSVNPAYLDEFKKIGQKRQRQLDTVLEFSGNIYVFP